MDLMQEKAFDDFVLVGGTALSLRLGHRISVDIDLFTDKPYNSLDFDAITAFFNYRYPYVYTPDKTDIVGLGRSYYVGASDRECIKVDLYYTDTFIRPYSFVGNIRLASLDDIVAMKVDVISRKGRKKDFWDLHELLERYSIQKMLDLHKQRYPYTHNKELILSNFTDFKAADEDFDPICLRGKYWEVIKADFMDSIKQFTPI
jgi:predicted nucleotidyltransferase component of viral defense system